MIVEARAVSQRYGKRWVFRDLDLEIGPGVTALLGPNGAGKTTLMRTMCALHIPAGGTLRVLDIDVSHRHDRRALSGRIGYLPQAFGYYPNFTVREFVAYAAWLKRVPRGRLSSLVDDAVESVGLTGRAGDKLRTLSGGMLRRAGIAHAIVHRPELLILDEPTVGLDPQQRIELRELIRKISAESAVLVSTHLVEDVRVLCANVHVLAPGRLVFTGSPDDLAARAAEGALGDNDLERGYSSVLANAEVVT